MTDPRRVRMRELLDMIRDDSTAPNLRDYGLDRRADYERDMAAWQQRRQDLRDERQRLHADIIRDRARIAPDSP